MFSYSNWSVLTVNFLVVVYLALGGVTLSAILHLAGARWRYEIRILASSLFALFPLAFVLLVVLLVNADATFPWMKLAGEHKIGASPWDGFTFLAWREVIGILVAMAIHWIFIKRQAVSERSSEDAARFHRIACWIPYVYVVYGTMVAWDFEMFMVPGWQSGIFAMQEFVSFFGMFLSFLVIWIYALNSRDRLVRPVETFVYNYLAQMMLAFTLLWVYTFFAQYLTLWYGNIPEEVDRLNGMQDGHYTFIWWAMIVLKLVIPVFLTSHDVHPAQCQSDSGGSYLHHHRHDIRALCLDSRFSWRRWVISFCSCYSYQWSGRDNRFLPRSDAFAKHPIG